ncbi:MAG TPA: PQQ-binding-like beta-propeller repeat protein [Verrucomicrobiae bacterium]|nr:PQQ-binding-like beta-propeller repeat protein [Verrucomicrobiae bacterium]
MKLTRWLLMVSALCSEGTLRAGNWPAWRGPEGTGAAPGETLPLHWSPKENIRWKTALPEPGNSTPIVWKDRVFITQAAGERRVVICFDRKDGQILWQSGPAFSVKEPTHETNPQNSSSPVTDGERVIAWFGSAGLYCYDLEGKELWHRDLGRQRHIWGYGASPIISHDLCILNFGPGDRSFLLAVKKTTGEKVWQINDSTGNAGEKSSGPDKPQWIGSWSTPIVIQAAGREELVVTWPQKVMALAPATGQELWSCGGLNPLVYTSPLYQKEKEVVVAMGGFNGSALAVKAGGSGDVTKTRRLWHHRKTKQRIGSGVIHQEHFYILNDPGVAECFEITSGKLVWEERLKGPAAKSDNWSSMVLADGKLCAINQGGDAFVLEASPTFRVLSTNSLSEATIGSMAVSNGEIFVRTYQHLWCIGRQAGPEKPGTKPF